MTLLFADPLFQEHETGRHPESPARLRAITAQLKRCGLTERCALGSYRPRTPGEICQVHAPYVVEQVEELARRGGGYLDPDTVVSSASPAVALAAAGACVSAVDAVVQGQERTALCLVRPPGHHATAIHSMGFCLFNNVALAARHALDAHGLGRILIVDWDVHHGNGTQDIFYEDPRVLFFSIHRFDHGFYPGTGAAEETGRGPGLGYTVNAPIRFGTPREEYHARFLRALEQAADKIKPELVLVSAGFDGHQRDPIGSLGLETEDFATLTQRVMEIARAHAGGRLVSCLEGGYDVQALAESVQTHLEKLLSQEPPAA
jgi:acetoin utilization deacetylase AcuC-like enzyme